MTNIFSGLKNIFITKNKEEKTFSKLEFLAGIEAIKTSLPDHHDINNDLMEAYNSEGIDEKITESEALDFIQRATGNNHEFLLEIIKSNKLISYHEEIPAQAERFTLRAQSHEPANISATTSSSLPSSSDDLHINL